MRNKIVLGGIFAMIAIILLVSYAVIVHHNNSLKEDADSSTYFVPEEMELQYDKYFVDNQVAITLKENNNSEEYATKMANDLDAEIVIKSETFNDFIMEFHNLNFTTENELIAYCDEIKRNYSEVIDCTMNELYPS